MFGRDYERNLGKNKVNNKNKLDKSYTIKGQLKNEVWWTAGTKRGEVLPGLSSLYMTRLDRQFVHIIMSY